jgi:catechol 2,3-dioxygenase-like lactoylglutathione lyase family enzyme
MNGLLSQLAHLELESPRLDETVAFFTDVFGMHETERVGDRVYLRAWGDPFHHSLVVSEGEQAQLGHVGWRAAGTEQLEAAVSRLEELRYGEGWIEGDRGTARRTATGRLAGIFTRFSGRLSGSRRSLTCAPRFQCAFRNSLRSGWGSARSTTSQ